MSTIHYTIGLSSLDENNKSCDVIEFLSLIQKSNNDAYELIWKIDNKHHNKNDHVRALVDLDGKMPKETTLKEFTDMDAAIIAALQSIDFETEYSIMTSSKYQNKKGTPDESNKLSYRITFTQKCGNLNAVKRWTGAFVAPKIQIALNDIIPFVINTTEDATKNYLKYDTAIYRPGKIRCCNASKPAENRPYKLIRGELIDTVLRYIPEDCDVLEDVAPAAPIAPKPYKKPTQSKAPSINKGLLIDVINSIPADCDYNDWRSVGMACFNEGIALDVWDEWSATSAKYKAGECAAKWDTFKSGSLSQGTLWYLLKKHNPTKYVELHAQREDFKKLLELPTHAAAASFFFNNNPDDYLYCSKGKWFNVLSNGVWENSEAVPATMRSKITKFFNRELLQLEAATLAKKRDAGDDKDVIEQLDKITKRCIDFRRNIEHNSFQVGLIANLSGYYAERAASVMENAGVALSDGVISLFDNNPNIWAFTDCCYDFKINDFRAIVPGDYITITCGYRRPDSSVAARKEIMTFLMSIWENEDDVAYMLKLLASCLCGVRNMEVFSILTGTGGNGKGVLWTLVQNMFGGYYKNLDITILTQSPKSAGAASSDLAALRGARLVGTSEPEADVKLHEGFIKLLTGGDLISCRGLFKNIFSFKPQFGLFLQCNNIPIFTELTQGGVRRNRVIPFPFNFVDHPESPTERKGNPDIKNVFAKSDEWRGAFFHLLLSQYSTIKGKSIDAIPTPARVVEATRAYTDENDQVGAWFRETYERATDSYILSRDSFDKFRCSTGIRITDKEFKRGLSYSRIDIVMGTRGDAKGRMIINGWKLKVDELVNPE